MSVDTKTIHNKLENFMTELKPVELTTVSELIKELQGVSPKTKVFVDGTHGYLHIVKDADGNDAVSFDDNKYI